MEFVNKYGLIEPDQILGSVNDYVKTLFPTTAVFLRIGTDGHTESLFPGFEKSFFSSQPFIKVKRYSEVFSRISVSANVSIDAPQIFSW